MALIETHHLSKSYQSVQALKDVNLRFENQTLYGLFGRNGAGKTTLLNILSGRIFADSGTVTCNGTGIAADNRTLVKSCCYMPEKHYFPPALKVKNLLGYARESFPDYSIQTEERLCRLFELDTGKKYQRLSRGYQSIFRIVIGLASNARITLLDEPVLGLDAAARDRFYQELIETFTENPRLFVVSTHLIEESADLFNEAVIIHEGRILRQAPVETLISDTYYVSGQSVWVDNFLKNRTVLSEHRINNLKTAVVEGEIESGQREPGLTLSRLTIKKLFIHMTGRHNEKEPDHA